MARRGLVSLALIAALFGALLPAASALARGQGTASERALLERLEALTERVEKLEKRVKELESRPRPARPLRAEQTEAYAIPLGESPFLGPKEAPVSVVVYNDFQCPFCARVQPLLDELVHDTELKGKVKVVFKHFPLSFHKAAMPAAKAAMAAREQGDAFFWKMSEKLFANQRELTSENFSRWAEEIGLDVARFESDLKRNDARYEAIIREDMRIGVEKAKVRGTPSIYVNGWELRQRSVDGVKALIREKGLL